jgi:glucosamine 6-phosphate synthetase-like amidotransferase/phosphosugar isomerase protein
LEEIRNIKKINYIKKPLNTSTIPQPSDKYHSLFSPITFIPALQLLAYYTAIKHDLNPDQPLNLAKTVTVH